MKRESRPTQRQQPDNEDKDPGLHPTGWMHVPMESEKPIGQRRRKHKRERTITHVELLSSVGASSGSVAASSFGSSSTPLGGLYVTQEQPAQFHHAQEQQYTRRQHKQPRQRHQQHQQEEGDKEDLEHQDEGELGGCTPTPKDKSATARITFEMLQQHFDKPLAEAAIKFGICTTAMKKIARKNGLTNWPFRHIVALQRSIASLENGLQFLLPEQQTKYLEQIQEQQLELQGFMTDPRAMNRKSGGKKQAGGAAPKSSKRKLPKLSETITLEMLRPHFEKPINEVASLLGVCPTLMKRICRQHKLVQWPYRHIVGLRKSIDSILAVLNQPQVEPHQRSAYNEKLAKQQHRLQCLLDDPATVLSNLTSGETWQDDSPLYRPAQPPAGTRKALMQDPTALEALSAHQQSGATRKQSKSLREVHERENYTSRGNAHTRLMGSGYSTVRGDTPHHAVPDRNRLRGPSQTSGASIASILNEDDTEE